MSSIKSKPNVLIYGLSANPPTGLQGHVGIVKYFAELFDEIWILPVYKHPYQTKRDLASFHHRLEMCKIAFSSINRDNIFIKDTEINVVQQAITKHNNPDISIGTIDVLNYIKSEYENKIQLNLLLGGDTYNDLIQGKWKQSQEILETINIVVVRRSGVDETEKNVSTSATTSFHYLPQIGDISSTCARSTTDEVVLRQHLLPQVISYIKSHKLYAFQQTEHASTDD